MTAAGPPPGPRSRPDGPPSETARASLVAGLRREVADARTRFEEATLRAEAHHLLGDEAGAAEVVREQEQILEEVQGRLARVVSASVVERDAEQVLADLGRTTSLPLPTADARPVLADPVHVERRPALAGVASVVAVLAVATAAVLGLTRSLDQVEVTEVAADATPTATTEDAPSDLAAETPPPVTTARPGGDASDPASVPAGPAPVALPDDDETTGSPAADEATEDAPSPTPEPTPELGDAVEQLVDAVAGLDGPAPDDEATDEDEPTEEDTTPGEDVDASIPGVDELSEHLDPGGR